MSRPIVVAFYAPADRFERFEKALRAGADAVIVDLEDAVSASHKADARAALTGFAALWEGVRRTGSRRAGAAERGRNLCT